ncbi:LamG domain-containing protein [Aeromonas veronii]|uniref:LamG domain-containing protein n=1 Tax=Aeromonas veronii TaxID=654 RepID=UPI0031FC0F2A
MDPLADKVKLYCSFDIGSAQPGLLPIENRVVNQITSVELASVGMPGQLFDSDNKWKGSASLDATYPPNGRIVDKDSAAYGLTPANPKLTVELWAYRKNAAATLMIGKSGKGNVSYANWVIGFKNNGAVYVSLGISGYMYGTPLGHLESAANIVPIGAWTHIALVMDGPNAKIYIGGVLAVNYTASQHPGDNYPLPFYIGCEDAQASSFTGYLIDDLRITAAVRYTGPFTPADYSEDYPPLIGGGVAPKLQPVTAIAANQEPRNQFQPQDVAWRGTPPLYPGPVNLQQQTQYPLCKGRDYFWIRDGVQNVLQGYIESTVTISGVGVRRRVLCFTQDGELVGETYSRASDGVYRFDLLWLNRRYMVVAQDDPAYGPADYNAVAADYQAPKPYPPGGGVAPEPFPMIAPLKRK